MLASLGVEWLKQSQDEIHRSFQGKNSRIKVSTASSPRLNKKNDQYAISFMTVKTKYCDWPEASHPSFENLFAKNNKFDYSQKIIKKCEEVVNSESDGYAFSFITIAASFQDFKHAQKHLHPKLNGDVCNVWSFPIPLYFEHQNVNKFYYLPDVPNLTKRHYLDYSQIEKLSGEWSALDIPNDGSLISLKFDGSRLPHYVSFTENVYFWLVFDGVRTSSNYSSKIHIGSHDLNF